MSNEREDGQDQERAHEAGLTEGDLAVRAAVSLEHVHRLIELGVVQERDAGSGFRPIDVQRIRVADAFVESGLAVEDLGRLVADGHVTFPNLEAVFGEPIAASEVTFAQFADRAGIEPELLRRVFTQLGLTQPADDARLREDDVEFLREFLYVFNAADLGLGDDFLLRAARLCGDSVRHLVEALNGLIREELFPAMVEAGGGTPRVRGGGPFVAMTSITSWLVRRHMETAIHGTIVENIELEMEKTGIGRRRELRPPAIGFLDLSGFTRLTGSHGDEEAARLAVRLSDLVQESTASRRGRAVKSLGDGVMLHFEEPSEAVAAALDLVEAIPAAGLPPARVGITCGAVIYRDGDYFGRAVNTASRITDYARPSEVLVSEAVAESGAAGSVFEDLGVVELKGIQDPVRLFRAIRTAGAEAQQP